MTDTILAMPSTPQRAVVLVSGGLDSATCLAIARERGDECYALSFDYGQRARAELRAAEQIAKMLGAKAHKTLTLNLSAIGGSALTDEAIAVPVATTPGIPVTYVPARNTVFLALALGWAEVLGARRIVIGVNAIDYSGYPDCRPEFIRAFQALANLATRMGVEGSSIKIDTPLIDLTKADIIQRGTQLGIDFGVTVSCYQADGSGRACGRCDACRLRAAGFSSAGLADPTAYQLTDA